MTKSKRPSTTSAGANAANAKHDRAPTTCDACGADLHAGGVLALLELPDGTQLCSSECAAP